MAMHPMLNTAVKAARAAGKVINRAELDLDQLKVGLKGPQDFVTEADQAAEQAIIQVLQTAYPNHAILAEESGSSSPDNNSDYEWIIDPIDGTINFIHGNPYYAISIALRVHGQIQQAVVYNPSSNDLFCGTRGEGAFLNNRRIRVSKRSKPNEFLIGFAFPNGPQEGLESIKKTMLSLTETTAGIRKTGSAALDLAHIACGRLDGYLCCGLKPWDMAAGALLISEAGGLITDLQGESNFLEEGSAIAGNPKALQFLIQNKI